MKRLRKKKPKGYLFESWKHKHNSINFSFPEDYSLLGTVTVPVSIKQIFMIHDHIKKETSLARETGTNK